MVPSGESSATRWDESTDLENMNVQDKKDRGTRPPSSALHAARLACTFPRGYSIFILSSKHIYVIPLFLFQCLSTFPIILYRHIVSKCKETRESIISVQVRLYTVVDLFSNLVTWIRCVLFSFRIAQRCAGRLGQSKNRYNKNGKC